MSAPFEMYGAIADHKSMTFCIFFRPPPKVEFPRRSLARGGDVSGLRGIVVPVPTVPWVSLAYDRVSTPLSNHFARASGLKRFFPYKPFDWWLVGVVSGSRLIPG